MSLSQPGQPLRPMTEGDSGVGWPQQATISCLSFARVQALLCFRPQECDLDIPGGPVVQFCDLARDLQLHAFPEFVSATSPCLFLHWAGDRACKNT